MWVCVQLMRMFARGMPVIAVDLVLDFAEPILAGGDQVEDHQGDPQVPIVDQG